MYYLSNVASVCYQATASTLNFATTLIPKPIKEAASASTNYIKNLDVVTKVKAAIFAKISPTTPHPYHVVKTNKLIQSKKRLIQIETGARKKLDSAEHDGQRKNILQLVNKAGSQIQSIEKRTEALQKIESQEIWKRLQFHLGHSVKFVAAAVLPPYAAMLQTITSLSIIAFTTYQQEKIINKLPNDEDSEREKKEVRKNTLITVAWTVTSMVAFYFLWPYVQQGTMYMAHNVFCKPGYCDS